MLPAAFSSTSDLTSLVGGLAAAIAVGAFIGQTLTAFVAAGALGVNDIVQAVIGMLGLVITCLMVGAIDVHYSRKALERGEDPDAF